MYGILINETATFSWDPLKWDPYECMGYIQMYEIHTNVSDTYK